MACIETLKGVQTHINNTGTLSMTQRYAEYETDGSSTTYDNIELRFTPYTTVEATVDRVFGSGSEFGQSLGVNFSDVRVVDGALYVDPEKEAYKLFSWKNVAGLSISESLERGNSPNASDAPEVETKNYAGNDKTYELVAARVPEVTGTDGDVRLEASSRERTVEVEDGEVTDVSDWTDLSGDKPTLESTITWYNGSEEHGPSASSKSLLEVLSVFGSDAVEDEDDLYNWLPDASGEDIMRDDLEDRRVRFLTITRESGNGYTYHDPILEDLATGEEINPNNRLTESDAIEEARERDEGAYPEPVADFVQSGRNLNLTEARADGLLDELLESTDNGLTESMLEDVGGREELINEVI